MLTNLLSVLQTGLSSGYIGGNDRALRGFREDWRGRMGVVYKARDTRLGRFVALKTLGPDKLDWSSFRERLLREARTASSLNHPNVVTIYDVEPVEGGSYLIAMEYVDGRPLGDVITPAGIVHRDLNLRTTDDSVKILDFGLARQVESSNAETLWKTTLSAVTEPGTIVGTVSYMSSEQLIGLPADGRSDIFSFGVILYETLAGERPLVQGICYQVSRKSNRVPRRH